MERKHSYALKAWIVGKDGKAVPLEPLYGKRNMLAKMLAGCIFLTFVLIISIPVFIAASIFYYQEITFFGVVGFGGFFIISFYWRNSNVARVS